MTRIDLFGAVGDAWEEGFTVSSVAAQLDAAGDSELLVRINSPGGFADDGVAIYNMLAERKPRVEILGIAASAASVIAMAGETIEMRKGARMMIHDAWTVTLGDPKAHAEAFDRLDSLSDQMAAIYAGRTGADPTQIRGWMKAEKWMDGNEAAEHGFATAIAEEAAEGEPAIAQSVLATMGCQTTLEQADADRKRQINRRAFTRYRVQQLTAHRV